MFLETLKASLTLKAAVNIDINSRAALLAMKC